MPLETTQTIQGLVSSNPTGTDSTTEGNDHIQLIKGVLKAIFPGVASQGFAIPIVATEAELNFSSGVTSSIQQQIDDVIVNSGGDLGGEAQTRADADTALGIRIDVEEANRISTLQGEANLRAEGDLSLQDDIDTEVGLRFSGDNTLQNNINTVQSNLDTEESARISADGSLQSQIDQVAGGEGAFPSGTKLLFPQAAAPLGWTQDVAVNDRYLRITSGAGGGQAGTDSPGSGRTLALAHVHNTAGHRLTVAELPPHTHSQTNQGTELTNAAAGGSSVPLASVGVTGSTGGNEFHDHANTGTTLSSYTIAFKYMNTILATKS